MEKFKHQSWADFSDEDSSATEEEVPQIDPNKKSMLEKLNSSNLPEFTFKIENLPYTLTGPEDLYCLLDLKPKDVIIKLQYKGKKFSGYAIVEARDKATALIVASKYGAGFNGRSLLVYFKDEDGCWVPNKKVLKDSDLNSTRLVNQKVFTKTSVAQEKVKNKVNKWISPKEIMKNDPAVIKIEVKVKPKVFKSLFN